MTGHAMIDNKSCSSEAAAQSFARFNARSDVADIVSRYADWARSSEGIGTGIQLSLLVMQRVLGQMPRPAYRRAVRDLAATTTIPLRDFRVLAECHLELLRSGLAGTGHIPFTPELWDDEEGEL